LRREARRADRKEDEVGAAVFATRGREAGGMRTMSRAIET
jgi:hypothetical protein